LGLPDYRSIEVTDVVLTQVSHRLPQVRLTRTAEDLRRGGRDADVGGPEQQSSAPHAILGTAHDETNRDFLPGTANGCEIVYDGLERVCLSVPD
jgi:hypothetical protein